MAQMDYKESADFIRNDLRLKTLPVAVKFLKETAAFPEKTRQPSVVLGKRVTICQGVSMARTYGWTVGLTQEDLILRWIQRAMYMWSDLIQTTPLKLVPVGRSLR